MAKLRRYQGEFAISSTVWHELLYGMRRLDDGPRKRTLYRYFHRLQSRVPILAYDRRAASWQADERVRLGSTRPYADSQIAAVAAVHDLVLVTANMRHFEGFDKLRVENWASERSWHFP